MKTSQLLTASLIALCSIGFVHAQTPVQPHQKLAKYHESILKKTTEINTANNDDAKKKAQEIGATLDSAKVQHQAIQAQQSTSQKTFSQQHLDIIAKNHAHSVQYNEELKKELAKPNPDKSKIKQNTFSIAYEVNEAKKHHEEIKKNAGLK
jgi:cell wall-associated NlpC family hydrolase